MSPRRKSGLTKDDLEALKHLDAVLAAVRKVTALGVDLRAAVGVWSDVRPLGAATPFGDGVGRGVDRIMREVAQGERGGSIHPPPGPTTLDTPERQEFERARKAGVAVPPPDLANISEAQRERMAEQKALVEQLRAAKGKPARDPFPPGFGERVLGGADPETEAREEAVREEELPTSPNGSAGVEMQSGGFIDG